MRPAENICGAMLRDLIESTFVDGNQFPDRATQGAHGVPKVNTRQCCFPGNGRAVDRGSGPRLKNTSRLLSHRRARTHVPSNARASTPTPTLHKIFVATSSALPRCFRPRAGTTVRSACSDLGSNKGARASHAHISLARPACSSADDMRIHVLTCCG